MLTSLQVDGFRGLKSLTVEKLARVNLFVGDNNSGKTSLLEAIHILLGRGTPWLMEGCLRRRREVYVGRGEIDEDADFSHLFADHALTVGAKFRIAGVNGGPHDVILRVIDVKDVSAEQLREFQLYAREPEDGDRASRRGKRGRMEDAAPPFDQVFEFSGSALSDGPVVLPVPSTMPAREAFRALSTKMNPGNLPEQKFLTTGGVDVDSLAPLWGDIALSPEEGVVADALKIIEPRMDRLAFVPSTFRQSHCFVLLKGEASRIPLGSFGEGMTRLLQLIVNLIHAKNGYLLIDEIDTGLHHSAMVEMWRVVIATARRLNVQLFATTHSFDCLSALGELYLDDESIQGGVVLHRVEKQYRDTTIYRAEELASIPRERMEVRG